MAPREQLGAVKHRLGDLGEALRRESGRCLELSVLKHRILATLPHWRSAPTSTEELTVTSSLRRRHRLPPALECITAPVVGSFLQVVAVLGL